MRYLEYIWAAISFGTLWVMGNRSVQLFAWAIGMIAPFMFGSALAFKLHKTSLVLALVASLIAIVFFVWWLVTLDYWMSAPPPSDCGSETCDNDAEIRTLFEAGALLLPTIVPSLIFGPVVFLFALRRSFAVRKMTPAQVG